MFLLILSSFLFVCSPCPALHSTMFLLIQEVRFTTWSNWYFTFHNVSINTWRRRGLLTMVDDALHSTMFLLIQLLEVARQQVLPTLHSTMFLLIQILTGEIKKWLYTLHSTMFLLIRYPGEPVQRKNGPLHSTMFLLIPEAGKFTWEGFKNFTFHNVSINTSSWRHSSWSSIDFTFHNVSINTASVR